MDRITTNTKNYQNIYNDYNSHTMKLKDLCTKYGIKSTQTIYNIVDQVNKDTLGNEKQAIKKPNKQEKERIALRALGAIDTISKTPLEKPQLQRMNNESKNQSLSRRNSTNNITASEMYEHQVQKKPTKPRGSVVDLAKLYPKLV